MQDLARKDAREQQLELLERALGYVQKGDWGAAELFYVDALEQARSALGTEDMGVVNIERSLAQVYVTQGKHALARPLCESVLSAMEREHGEQHVMTAGALLTLAEALRGAAKATDGASDAPTLTNQASVLEQRAARIMENEHEPRSSSESEGEDDEDEEEDEEEDEDEDEESDDDDDEKEEGGKEAEDDEDEKEGGRGNEGRAGPKDGDTAQESRFEHKTVDDEGKEDEDEEKY